MSEITVSYSPQSSGWTSFWSYKPDWMTGMNNSFYTWKNGSLYKHDTNSARNRFYGSDNESSITTILNQDPTTSKMFKTLYLDSNMSWDAQVNTDLNAGEIVSSSFNEKEGMWYGYIRRNDGDLDHKAISTQGIGEVDSFSSNVLTFSFRLNTSISQGDSLYKVVGGALTLIGVVASHNTTTITLVSTISAPSSGDLIVYVKNSVAESYGTRGDFLTVTLTNASTDNVEIFEVGSSIFKSFP
jgi:hypothetical protein